MSPSPATATAYLDLPWGMIPGSPAARGWSRKGAVPANPPATNTDRPAGRRVIVGEARYSPAAFGLRIGSYVIVLSLFRSAESMQLVMPAVTMLPSVSARQCHDWWEQPPITRVSLVSIGFP
jgi:hypothetical protein